MKCSCIAPIAIVAELNNVFTLIPFSSSVPRAKVLDECMLFCFKDGEVDNTHMPVHRKESTFHFYSFQQVYVYGQRKPSLNLSYMLRVSFDPLDISILIAECHYAHLLILFQIWLWIFQRPLQFFPADSLELNVFVR